MSCCKEASLQTVHGPIGGRRRLRTALRRARDISGLTQEQVAATMDWSLSKLIRIEAGTVSISTNDLKALLQLYRITDPVQVSEFVEIARVARRRAWWAPHKDHIPSSYGTYIGLEAEADELCSYHSVGLPGLLQTEDYARAMVDAVAPMHLRRDDVERRVEIRMQRQRAVFSQAVPLRMSCVIDEAALRRQTGGIEVMREQLLHLEDLGNQTNIVIRVFPFTAGNYTNLGHFLILKFPDPDDTDVVYLENRESGGLVIDEPTDTRPYLETFLRLQERSLPRTDSLAFIRRIADEMGANSNTVIVARGPSTPPERLPLRTAPSPEL
ncbi:MAG TPA: helix-turn-helix transcriptional regulator [Micromonospora sp.]|nr:helix-turn-helix transcriptional regulator [Micromonospora sp.]